MTCVCKDKRDVEAVAKARVARAEGKSQAYWMFGFATVALAGGILIPNIPEIARWVVLIVGCGGILWFSNRFSNKQKAAAAKLVREWEQERK